LNISGAIVSQDSEITPERAVQRAFETLCHAERCGEAWKETHDENGKMKDPLEILQNLGNKLNPQNIEKIGDRIAKKFGKSGEFPQ
jgi:hypothetical protein